MKSGNLNFLEPSGPLQACNGTALPFYPFIRVSRGLKVEESGSDSKKKKRQKVSLHRHIHTGCGSSKILTRWVPNASFPGNKPGSVQS